MLGMSILLGGRGNRAWRVRSFQLAGQVKNQLKIWLGILFGYLIAVGYASLGLARNVWMAAACAMVAHAGGSTVWVFSTTLLQLNAEDRFPGRFRRRLGHGELHLCRDRLSRRSFPRCRIPCMSVATTTGIFMLVPAAILAHGASFEIHRLLLDLCKILIHFVQRSPVNSGLCGQDANVTAGF